MKLLLTAALLALPAYCFGQSKAMAGPHRLTVFSESGAPFYLEIDGRRSGAVAFSHVTLSGLTPGPHQARIIFADRRLSSLYGRVDAGTAEPVEVTYAAGNQQLVPVRWQRVDGSLAGQGAVETPALTRTELDTLAAELKAVVELLQCQRARLDAIASRLEPALTR